MYTTGAVLLPFFAALSLLIAVPTGIKFFNWIGTMWRGTITINTATLYCLGFLTMFLFGGITGVILAQPVLDFQLHNTYFVVAHFHYVIMGLVFGGIAGLYYWFPKITGRMLGEGLGKASFLLMFIGVLTTFLIQHVIGLDGMPRRVYEYENVGHLELYNQISTVGAFILALGVLLTIVNVVRSLKTGVVAGGDPWKANTLEWFTPSPPPQNNFDQVPVVRSAEPMKDIRREIERRTTGAPVSAAVVPAGATQVGV